MHRKGMGVMQIVEQTGLSWTAVNTPLRLYGEGSMATLKPDIRGKKPGSGRSLTRAQEQAIQQTICGNRPEQLKMDYALWSSIRPLRPKPRQKVQRFIGAMRQRGSSPMSGTRATRLWGKFKRKVFLILDNLRVHHGKPVKAWAVENAKRIELLYLPT